MQPIGTVFVLRITRVPFLASLYRGGKATVHNLWPSYPTRPYSNGRPSSTLPTAFRGKVIAVAPAITADVRRESADGLRSTLRGLALEV